MADIVLDKRSERVSFAIGLAFWAAIAAAVAFFTLRADRADIFLDVAAAPDLSVAGIVHYQGKPVSSGHVHVVVHCAKSDRYLGGTVVPVGGDGRFAVKALQLARDEENSNTLQVTASYRGHMQAEQKSKQLGGEATAYLNFTPPFGTHGLALAGGGTLLLLWLIYLFTSGMTRRKGRLLFGTMYIMTFLSLAVPVGMTLWFSQNGYMKELAAEAPMGLVHAVAPGTTGPQWVVNIGGQIPARRSPAATETARGAETPAVYAAARDDRDAASLKRIAGGVAPGEKGVDGVHGGLIVPLYVVLLAMFGAGINMTRKVPEIQKRYEGSLLESKGPSLIAKPIQAMGMLLQGQGSCPEQPAAGASEMREELIRNYMYLLSAPLLAIAMYYLLQVISNGVNQPVLVLMAFATGLTSELIVSAIITFADKMLDTLRKPKELVAVPRLLGLDMESAGAALRQADLVPGTRTEQASSTSTPGTIIGQDPKGGDLVAPRTQVKLIVARPPKIQVPHLLGMTRDGAAGRLAQMGLVAGGLREEASAASPGTVIAQDPAGGIAAEPGATVALTLAKPQAAAPVSAERPAPALAGTGEKNAPGNAAAGT